MPATSSLNQTQRPENLPDHRRQSRHSENNCQTSRHRTRKCFRASPPRRKSQPRKTPARKRRAHRLRRRRHQRRPRARTGRPRHRRKPGQRRRQRSCRYNSAQIRNQRNRRSPWSGARHIAHNKTKSFLGILLQRRRRPTRRTRFSESRSVRCRNGIIRPDSDWQRIAPGTILSEVIAPFPITLQ